MTAMRVLAVGLLGLPAWGCGLIGPSCTAQREEGPVATVSGEVGAGAIAFHDVAYRTQGSQNNGQLTWEGQSTGGPRIQVYATRADCVGFQAPPAVNAGNCAVLAAAGWFNGQIANTIIVTHGRGNPERLGTPPVFRLWVVGDAERSARYTIVVTYFYGPDC